MRFPQIRRLKTTIVVGRCSGGISGRHINGRDGDSVATDDHGPTALADEFDLNEDHHAAPCIDHVVLDAGVPEI